MTSSSHQSMNDDDDMVRMFLKAWQSFSDESNNDSLDTTTHVIKNVKSTATQTNEIKTPVI